MPFETIAEILYLANFVLALIAVVLSLIFFRTSRNYGWFVLACAFLTPFVILFLDLAHGLSWRAYQSIVPSQNGVAQVTYNLQIPWFYIAVVTALLLLKKEIVRPKT